jgi:hypothetical protein
VKGENTPAVRLSAKASRRLAPLAEGPGFPISTSQLWARSPAADTMNMTQARGLALDFIFALGSVEFVAAYVQTGTWLLIAACALWLVGFGMMSLGGR